MNENIYWNNSIKDIIELTSSQKGILFDSISNSSNSFVVQILLTFEGELNFDDLEYAFNALVNSHDALKSNIIYDGLNEPVRIIYNNKNTSIEKITIDSKKKLKTIVEDDKDYGFNLKEDTLIRLKLIEDGSKDSNILITFHHIIMDGWCKEIIFNDLFEHYFDKEKVYRNSSSDIEYINWRKRLNLSSIKNYWNEYLKNYNGDTTVPYKNKKNKIDEDSSDYRELRFFTDRKKTEKLKSFADENNVTINAVLMSSWGVLLQQLNNSDDIIFGMATSGRNIPIDNVNNIIGLFTNIVPIRISECKNETINKFIRNTNENILNNQYNDLLPLNKISNSIGHTSLFDHIVLYENKDNSTYRKLLNNKELCLKDEQIFEHTMYSMTLTFEIKNQILDYHFIYDNKIIKEEDIRNISNILDSVINQLISSNEMKVKDIKVVDEEQIKKINNVDGMNGEISGKSIIEYFKEQVNREPNNIALELGNESLTYKELDKRSDEICYLIKQKNIHFSPIAIYFDRDFDMISSMLAILKSDNFYMPIDFSIPKDRMINNINDVSAKLMLVNDNSLKNLDENTLNKLNSDGVEIINLSINERLNLFTYDFEKENHTLQNDLAYVMYTSGSTGKPKGVYIYQKAVNRLVKGSNYISISSNDKVLQLSNYAFDGSTFDIYGALLNGAKLVLISPKSISQIDSFISIIKEKQVSIMFITTALFNSIIDYDISCFNNVKKILFGGEIASPTHVNKLLRTIGKDRIIHVYGPTECTVFTSFYNVNKIVGKSLPIGMPVSKTQVYVLNTYGNIQPIGIEGELYVGGEGIAKGYTDIEVSKEKFVRNENVSDDILYKTGDICFINNSLELVFIGRKDGQVKFRGFRIELGEISSDISKIDGVKQVYVSTVLDNKRIIRIEAFVVQDSNITEDFIRTELRKSLPDYMIPTQIEFVDNLPINSNGKVDKVALYSMLDKNDEVVEEGLTEIQTMLLDIIKEVLKINKVTLNDNFYTLGGDSIKAIQLASKLRERNYQISIRSILEGTTIFEISEGIIKSCIEQEKQVISEKYQNLKELFSN